MPNWDNTEQVRLLNAHYIPLPANLGVRVYASQGFTHDKTGAWAEITFDAEHWDTGITNDYVDGFWAVANPTRLTAVKRGWYDICGHVKFASDNTGRRGIAIRESGVTTIAVDMRDSVQGADTMISISTKYWLNVGEYVELQVYQNSGGNLNVDRVANYTPEFAMVRIP